MSDLDSLFRELQRFRTMPVHEWHPEDELDIRLRIDVRGAWYHQGSPIRRERLVKLFASVLRREPDGSYNLVTPAMRYPVTVEAVPFMAVELRRIGEGPRQQLVFRTNVDDVVGADAAHPITFVSSADSQQPLPCITVRDALLAKMTRPVYYELVEGMVTGPESSGRQCGVYSNGEFFVLGTL